ncbi:MAG: hypothetical protein E4H26_02790 [Flavobacteriales bacterium]|nr:MAG: hypothetical protein E4H26_02790 [Flavobacteriales bacterium]
MKKTGVIAGIVILSLGILSFTGKGHCQKSTENRESEKVSADLQQSFRNSLPAETNPTTLNIDEIAYVELEEEIVLGFDTADYLPLGFNAYEGMVFDLNDIDYVELEEEIDLGFNTADYLPEGFNAYEGMDLDLQLALEELDLNSINYIEEEEVIELDFNTRKYLPKGFDPYAK